MKTPQKDIDRMLAVERQVPEDERKLYMECVNNKPLASRTTDQEIRDGCILIGMVYLRCSKHKWNIGDLRVEVEK